MSQLLTGPAVKSVEACFVFLVKHNVNYDFEIGDLDYLVNSYFDIAPHWNLRPDILIAQMCYETNYYRSMLSQAPWNNLAGIGASASPGPAADFVLDPADGKYKKALKFPNVSWGVWAHCSHMYCYINSASIYNELTTTAAFFDPRYGLTRSVRLHKLPARTTADLTNAWGGDNYGTKVDSIYDAI